MPTTSCPDRSNSSTRYPAMKPAEPETRVFISAQTRLRFRIRSLPLRSLRIDISDQISIDRFSSQAIVLGMLANEPAVCPLRPKDHHRANPLSSQPAHRLEKSGTRHRH